LFSTETSSSNAIRSVFPSPEIGDARESRIENHQRCQSTINIVEGGNGPVFCTLGNPVEENVIIVDEARMVVRFSKTATNGPNIEELVTNSVFSINDPEAVINVNKKQSSVSLEKPRRPLLETHL